MCPFFIFLVPGCPIGLAQSNIFYILKYIEDLKLTAFYAETDPGCNGGTVIDNPDILVSLVSIDCSVRGD